MAAQAASTPQSRAAEAEVVVAPDFPLALALGDGDAEDVHSSTLHSSAPTAWDAYMLGTVYSR